MKKQLKFHAVLATQSDTHTVVSFAASADDINRFAEIERIGRDDQGQLSGFQRPQIASHIREIKDYLQKPDAILPNPIVVAFTRGVTVKPIDDAVVTCSIDISKGPLGLVVDGQQRLSALSQITDKNFKVFVSLIVCADEAELRRQFVLINNTRPLPKSLIYELLPGVDNLPARFEGRSLASELTEKLNHGKWSLNGKIRQHTNPTGLINDTAIQRVIMNSLNDGIMREFMREPGGKAECLRLVSEFYRAVGQVFPQDWWWGHTPKTSRLIHGAGIVAMGYVMEVLAVLEGARRWDEFAKGMGCLSGRTAWTSGQWDFGGGDVRHWRAIQNVNKDINTLAQHLVQIVRSDIKARRSRPQAMPLFDEKVG